MKRLVISSLLITALAAPAAYGQGCSICTKTAQGLDDHAARGLNGGILYLAFLPLGIIGTVGFVWWRSKR